MRKPVETFALSVYNMLSHARRPLNTFELTALLQRPQVWDPETTEDEVRAGAAYLLARKWIVATGDTLDMQRDPNTKTGRDVIRNPLDPNGLELMRLASFQ